MSAARVLAVIGVIGLLAVGAWLWIGGGGAGTTGVGPGTGPGDGSTPENPATGEETDVALPRAMITIVPGLDDRLYPEPCHEFGVGGLYSVTALMDEMRRYAPTVGVSMGDISTARGAVGEEHLGPLYHLVMPHAGVLVVCPGEGELGISAAFVRTNLTEAATRNGFEIIGANVADALGRPLLKGWEVAQAKLDPPAPQLPRHILFVSVVADSLQKQLDARGSDIKILPARESLENALQDGLARSRSAGHHIANRVLLVQGSVDEAAALVSADMQFDFIVAARGGVLPDRKPRVVHGAPIYFGGRGARFGWRVIIDDAVRDTSAPGAAPPSVKGYIVRLGQSLLSQGSPLEEALPPLREVMIPDAFGKVVAANGRFPDPRGRYVGSASCATCHAEISAAHDGSAHARRLPQLPVLMSCAKCHVTGFDAAGGWKGREDKSELGSISCEACHGPAEKHIADTSQPYGAFSLDRCTQCHLPDHTPGFDPEALWEQLGHAQGQRGDDR